MATTTRAPLPVQDWADELEDAFTRSTVVKTTTNPWGWTVTAEVQVDHGMAYDRWGTLTFTFDHDGCPLESGIVAHAGHTVQELIGGELGQFLAEFDRCRGLGWE